jgi:hypothetical protein
MLPSMLTLTRQNGWMGEDVEVLGIFFLGKQG